MNSSVKVNIHINQEECNYYSINKYEIVKKFDVGNETMKGSCLFLWALCRICRDMRQVCNQIVPNSSTKIVY